MAGPRGPGSDSLWKSGCLGAALGFVLTVLGLLALGVWTAFVGPLTPLEDDPGQADIIITVQEAFFAQQIASALPRLPSGVASDIALDLKPDNRLLLQGRLAAKLLGQTLGGDFSVTVLLQVENGGLAIRFEDMRVFGFTLAGLGETLLNEVAERAGGVIDDQIKAGIGSDSYILSLTTDEQRMVIRARLR